MAYSPKIHLGSSPGLLKVPGPARIPPAAAGAGSGCPAARSQPGVVRTMRPLQRWPARRVGRAAALALAVLAGCGDGDNAAPSVTTYEAKGKVTLPDGKPLTSGQVYLVPVKGSPLDAYGKIGPDGTFALTTLGGKAGAPAGEYKVRIEPDPAAAPKPDRRGVAKFPFPAKFADEDTSGVVVTIEPKPNDLNIHLGAK